MKKNLLTLLFGMFFIIGQSIAQDLTITGTVTAADDGLPLPGVSVKIKSSGLGTQTNVDGKYTIKAKTGDVLVFTYLGTVTQEKAVGSALVINASLAQDARALDEVVVTALGIKQEKKSLGYAATEVKGAEIAKTQRDNFLNALQGRVPGVSVTSTSGLPGSSASVVIRGINSISGNNQPLFIIDGIPVDNKTFSSAGLASDKPGSQNALSNRTVDFSNRASDINPEDIESITVLKGPEAAALYGIEAGSGAIIITTKKGKAGSARINYSNSFTLEDLYKFPDVQSTYSQGSGGVPNANTFVAFGPAYAQGTPLFNNTENFFNTGFAQRHNLSIDGGTEKVTYRLSSSFSGRDGVVPSTSYDRFNINLSGTAKWSEYITSETSLQYINTANDKASKGQNSFLLGLIAWPQTDDMENYLGPGGIRRRVTSGSEIENPYFDINKNKLSDKGDRFIGNLGFIADPTKWLQLTARVGFDIYSSRYSVKYHPESNRAGGVIGGSLDLSNDNTRNLNLQTFARVKKTYGKFGTTLLIGSAIYDNRSDVVSVRGESFQDPNFTSINNTGIGKTIPYQTTTQKRLIGVFGNWQWSYNGLLYLTVTGRNDVTSTLSKENNSFFYPSLNTSFVFSELKKIQNFTNNKLSFGKLRASIAQVGKDARPYSLFPALENQGTTGGGFLYGFTAPSPDLKPEKITSYEFGTEIKFFKDRVGIDATYYRSKSVNQIIQGLRYSYASGYILKNVNGGELNNSGWEIQLLGTPIQTKDFSWETTFNFDMKKSKLVKLSDQISEFYDSDTFLYSNVRNGVRVGGPLTTFTGNSYQRNSKGDILISPTSGLPLTETLFNIVGDRNPDFTLGWNNNLSYKNLNLSFLLDMRRGGDVYNATGLYMYINGFDKRTLDRETPRIVTGIIKDGLENTDNPTRNNILVTPYLNNSYYNSIADEQFIEKDINWLRLRDVTLRYTITGEFLRKLKAFRSASVFATATDLFLISNYSGADPGVNGTTAATAGSGGTGIDYGNLSTPRVFNFGLSIGF